MACENCDCNNEPNDDRQLNITYGELKEVLKRMYNSVPVNEFMTNLANLKNEKFGDE